MSTFKSLLKGKMVLVLIIHSAIQVQALFLSLRTHQSYKNWATGDPNNGGLSRKKDEDCAVLKSNGKWNDYPCTTRFKYICKARASKLHINFIFHLP